MVPNFLIRIVPRRLFVMVRFGPIESIIQSDSLLYFRKADRV